jgi:hypothetical protein
MASGCEADIPRSVIESEAAATLYAHGSSFISRPAAEGFPAPALNNDSRSELLLRQVLVEKFADLRERLLGFRRTVIAQIVCMRLPFEDLQACHDPGLP